MTQDDPTATYRGYRRQALYCLYRVFDDGLSEDTVVHPEGNEDLEIRSKSGQRLEVIQVKDYTSDLTASSFKPSFYRRINELCTIDKTVTIKIVSFGPFGPELEKAYDNKKKTPTRSLNTLTKDREEKGTDGLSTNRKGLSDEEARTVFERVEIEVVDEHTLTQHVIEKLASTMTSGNPKVAFENLMWWLITSAEKQTRLTRSKTVKKLIHLGKFITHRNAHNQEWNVSIKPIQSVSPDAPTQERLRNEFFQGGRVRAEHVAAGLDVPRDQAITSIHRAFLDNDVVIVRGASGQGKTTLAYRYLLNWAPTDFRFQVEKAASLEHARLMAGAIAGHADCFDVPSIIYIDVSPGDKWWVEIVRALAGFHGIRVLVTVREEDMFRSQVSAQDFAFSEISMDFTEESASQMFSELRIAGYGDNQLDFRDAWIKLGNRKTLFEFVYLVTQNKQLWQRVEAQIGILKDEVNRGDLVDKELQLLRLVAVASAYEARLDLKALAEFIELPEPTRALQRFGEEYLLRTSADGQHVEGYHAIRSEIIAECLTDAILQPRAATESCLPPLVVEDDLESLLLCSFSRNKSAESGILQSLCKIQLNTWVGVRAVLVSLQWLGIKRYSSENMTLIKEVRSVSSSSWWFVLDWDLARINGDDGFDALQQLAKTSPQFENAAALSIDIQNRQSNKLVVFDLTRKWLESFKLPSIAPDSTNQYTSAAEVLYWLGHLGLQNQFVAKWLDSQVISTAWRILPLYLFGRFASGVRKYNSDLYLDWIAQHREAVEMRIRSDAAVIAFVEEGDCLVSHFLINLELKSSELTPSEQEASVYELAVQRVEIVAACLPGYARYGASGYGHHLSLIESLADDSVKRIPLENIKQWLPEFNGLSTGAVEYEFRPNSWSSYFTGVFEIRTAVLAAFTKLRNLLGKDEASNILDTAWEETRRIIDNKPLLPKPAVDEWGFVVESREAKTDNGIHSKFGTISTLKPFYRALNEYTFYLGNFFLYSMRTLIFKQVLESAESEFARQAIIAKGEELGVTENTQKLSVINGMDACIALKKLQNIERSFKLDDRMRFNDDFATDELRKFQSTMRAWMLYCYPDQVPSTARKQKKKNITKGGGLPKGLRDCLQATKNRITQELRKLKKRGIDARILNEDIEWNGESCLWVSFDTAHPLSSIAAIEEIWITLVEAFRPDREKIVRTKIIDYLWSKIILVPLVQGCSLDRQAYANMKGASYLLDEDIANQLWRFAPEEIPLNAWDNLGLRMGINSEEMRIFDDFVAAYGIIFQHVDHIADYTRCTVNLDECGERILREHTKAALKRSEVFAQKAIDSYQELASHFPEITESVNSARPNLLDCKNLVIELGATLMPSDDFDMNASLSFSEIIDWRNRLKSGLSLVGEARALWMADYLGLPRLDSS